MDGEKTKDIAEQVTSLHEQLKLMNSSLKELKSKIEGKESLLGGYKTSFEKNKSAARSEFDLSNWGTSELIVKLEFENYQLKKNIEILDYQRKKSNPSSLIFWFIVIIIFSCLCFLITIFPFIASFFPFQIPVQISSIAIILLLGLVVLLYHTWNKISKLTQKRRLFILKKIEAQDLKNYINQKLEKVSYIIDFKSDETLRNE